MTSAYFRIYMTTRYKLTRYLYFHMRDHRGRVHYRYTTFYFIVCGYETLTQKTTAKKLWLINGPTSTA